MDVGKLNTRRIRLAHATLKLYMFTMLEVGSLVLEWKQKVAISICCALWFVLFNFLRNQSVEMLIHEPHSTIRH